MLLEVHAGIKDALRKAVEERWKIEPPEIVLNQTPKIEMGELATPVCFELARRLKQPPRAAAADLIAAAGAIPGVKRMEVAGGGYINFYLDRTEILRRTFKQWRSNIQLRNVSADSGKIIVEHTNINPNKAAHIGHLRNAAIGDMFVRIMRSSGRTVEVQNYIDNTGVQVADVIVGFKHLLHNHLSDVVRLVEDPHQKFDHYCWDLYAQMASFYECEDPQYRLRAQTLKEIEEGHNETAETAELVSMAIVRHHLATMDRIGVQYDLLPRESDILHLKFWDRAFQLLRDRGAIFFETEGKNKGCWVMRLETEAYEEDKIIVRSNGTVTYVGKDIAYQLWKLGLLDRDFHYRIFHRYENGGTAWVTCSENGESSQPLFGHGKEVYNVIDARQSYLQNVVRQGVLALGYEEEAKKSIHFSYEMVSLSPACAEQLGIELPPEDRKKPYVEVSGRKGQGVKADDLLDTLEAESQKEVRKRNPEFTEEEIREIAHQIAVGALRYFLLKFTRNSIIAFDFREALNFDGETGPYLQYAVVRANNIYNKLKEVEPEFDVERVYEFLDDPKLRTLLEDNDEIWELVYTAARQDEIAQQVLTTLEPATLAKFAFALAQRFSLFYHRYRIISEQDPHRRLFYLLVVEAARQSISRTLDLMGIQIPKRM